LDIFKNSSTTVGKDSIGFSDFYTGEIKDIKTGETLGTHDGALLFTKGQRARISGCITPKYVLKIDAQENIVWVGENNDLFTQEVNLEKTTWTGKPAKNGEEISVRIRHGGEPLFGKIEINSDNTGKITLKEPVRAVTPGQSAVFYKGEKLLGGGIIN
jgi:tRNA-specific 2-thiouridylase